MSDTHITRRRFMGATAATVLLGGHVSSYGFTDQASVSSQEARDFFDNNYIFDGNMQPSTKKDGWIREQGQVKHLTGVNACCSTLTPDKLERVAGFLESQDDSFVHVLTSSDLAKAYQEGKHGYISYIQECASLAGGLDQIREWHKYGLRAFQPVFKESNELGGGVRDDKMPLSKLGFEVVALCEELGIAIDVSRCGRRTTLDIARHAKKPIVANQTNALGRCDAISNKSNAELRAIAGTGGVVGVVAVNTLLRKEGKASAEDYVDHLQHMVRLIGTDHVGIASTSYADGLNVDERYECGPTLRCYERWGRVAEILVKKRFKPESMEKVFGLNFKRVYEELLPAGTSEDPEGGFTR